MRTHPSRRQILGNALASSSLVSFVSPRFAFAEGAAATPECHDNHETTIRQTAGPFFRPSSPERADLIEPTLKDGWDHDLPHRLLFGPGGQNARGTDGPDAIDLA
jgi:hypothetical protein